MQECRESSDAAAESAPAERAHSIEKPLGEEACAIRQRKREEERKVECVVKAWENLQASSASMLSLN